MNLRDYLKANRIGVTAFSKKANLKQPFLSLLLSNKRSPSPNTALRISEATGGAVSVMELLFPSQSQSQSLRGQVSAPLDKAGEKADQEQVHVKS